MQASSDDVSLERWQSSRRHRLEPVLRSIHTVQLFTDGRGAGAAEAGSAIELQREGLETLPSDPGKFTFISDVIGCGRDKRNRRAARQADGTATTESWG